MSKGLEALERIGKVYYPAESRRLYLSEDYGDDFDVIEKELNALEIIKTKRVDVDYFLTIIEKYNELEKQMKVYNHLNSVYEMLTQDEFELLKKVLGK